MQFTKLLTKQIIVFLLILCGYATAAAQGFVVEADQVIGTVESYGGPDGIELDFDNPLRDSDFEVIVSDAGSEFSACVRVPAGPFLCLDAAGKTVKRFDGTPPPLDSVISCLDPALDFNLRKETCTAYTFGLDSHFIAGLGNGKSFQLARVFADAVCDNPLIQTPGLCAELLYTGRPLLLGLKLIDGKAAEDLGLGTSCVIGLEQRSDAVCFPVPAEPQPIMLADRRRWGVKGQESLQDIDILQIGNPVTSVVDNYAVVTSSSGRILAAKIGDSSSPVDAFEIADVPKLSGQCNADDQFFGLEIEGKSDTLIVTDRNFCQAFALVPELDVETDPVTGEITGGTGELTGFVIATETVIDGALISEEPLVLSTGTTAPLGATSSPGDTFDLVADGCTSPAGCTVVAGEGGVAGATVTELTLRNNETAATVFQGKQIPYCTYKPEYCVSLLDPTFAYPDAKPRRQEALDRLEQPDLGVVFRLPGASSLNQRPEEYVFNTTPVLPVEILERFDGIGSEPGQIPPLWIPPDFIPSDADYFYEALFFITAAQTDDFQLTFNVTALQGFPSFPGLSDGCELASELGGAFSADRAGLERLLAWDVVNRAAERFPSVDGPQSAPGANHQGHIVNIGCGSSRVRSGGFSLFPYNLKPSGCIGFHNGTGLIFDTFDSEDTVAGTVNCPVGDGDVSIARADDSTYAKLYVKLYDELFQHLDELACVADATGSAPITSGNCDALRATWLNGDDKLAKALAATFEPKSSAGNENFGAVISQLQNYLDTLRLAELAGTGGDDPAGRLPEQIARVLNLQHLLEDKVLPSIPDNGFNDSDRSWAQ